MNYIEELHEGESAGEYLRRIGKGIHEAAIASAAQLVHSIQPIGEANPGRLEDDPAWAMLRKRAEEYRATHSSTDAWQDLIHIPAEAVQALEKADARGKEDGSKAFLTRRDPDPWPWFQRPISYKLTRNLRKGTPSMIRKRIKPRTASNMGELLSQEGSGSLIRPFKDIPIITPVKLDECDVLDMRPMLYPEDAKAVSQRLRSRASKNKALKKSGPINQDPVWAKWKAEDKARLKTFRDRLRIPFFPLHRPNIESSAPTRQDEVKEAMWAAVPYLCQEVQRTYVAGSLDHTILGQDIDPMSLRLLADMDEPVIHHPPSSRAKRQLADPKRPRKEPALTILQMNELERQRGPAPDAGLNPPHRFHRPQRSEYLEVPRLRGVYDGTALSYQDFLAEDAVRDPLIEKVRGAGKHLNQLDWASVFIDETKLHEVMATSTDRNKHIARYGTWEHPAAAPPKTTRHNRQAVRSRAALPTHGHDGGHECRSRSTSLVPYEPQQLNAKRKYHDGASTGSTKPPAKAAKGSMSTVTDMDDLRNLVLVSEAKIDYTKVRTIEPMVSSREITELLKDLAPEKQNGIEGDSSGKSPAPASKSVKRQHSVVDLVSGSSATGKKKKPNEIKKDWRKHESIKNPNWYGKSIRSSTADTSTNGPQGTSLPVFLGSSVLSNRPMYRAIGDVNLDPVERDSWDIQYVDMILTPSIGVIFLPLDKLAKMGEGLLRRSKAAAVYFHRTIIVFEVIPYRHIAKKQGSSTDSEIESPLTPEMTKNLQDFRKALESTKEKAAEVIGAIEMVFATRGAEEVAMMLKGVTLGSNTDTTKNLTGESLFLWQNKNWVHSEIDPEEEITLIEAGFNLFSTHFILALCGSFASFSEGMNAPERLKMTGPVAGEKAVNRFNAKWWRRQTEIRKIQSSESEASAEMQTSPLAER